MDVNLRWRPALGDVDAQAELAPPPDVEAQAVVPGGGVKVHDPPQRPVRPIQGGCPATLLHQHAPMREVHPAGVGVGTDGRVFKPAQNPGLNGSWSRLEKSPMKAKKKKTQNRSSLNRTGQTIVKGPCILLK